MSDYIFDKKTKNSIQNFIRNELSAINEAYVAQQKKFDIKTDFLSESNVENHIKLYKGYLDSFNKISAKLDSADRSEANSNNDSFRSLKIDETYNLNGAYLHELYFANMADANSIINMDMLSYMRLNRDFGTFDDWQKDFIACGLSSRCGWVVTYLNTYTQTYMNTFIDLHSQHVPVGMYPVIIVDMWQHAYYKDYLKDSKTYLTAMMKELRWSVIEERFKKADKIIKVLRGNNEQ
jgi:Fe-Mn family superoxide dismutase